MLSFLGAWDDNVRESCCAEVARVSCRLASPRVSICADAHIAKSNKRNEENNLLKTSLIFYLIPS